MKECLRKERKMGKRLIRLLYLPVIAVQEKAQGGDPEREGLPGVDGYSVRCKRAHISIFT